MNNSISTAFPSYRSTNLAQITDEEAMRAQTMINSAKGDNDMLAYENNDDDNGMTNLAVEDDDEDYNDSTNITLQISKRARTTT
ncbi:MAG: hypothetical protein GY938_07810 [Ketobacter sp.]|nr:hypothetical protein [Ketobacter sp.]